METEAKIQAPEPVQLEDIPDSIERTRGLHYPNALGGRNRVFQLSSNLERR